MAGKMSIPMEERVLLARQLALVVDADLSLVEGLELVREGAGPGQVEKLLGEAVRDVGEGLSLGEAFKRQEERLTPFFANMVDLGEKTGNLTSLLDRLAQVYETEMETARKVRAALTYPLLLTLMMGLVVLLLVVKILPVFEEILRSLGAEMPALTRGLLRTGLFLQNRGGVLAMLLLVVLGVLYLWGRTESGSLALERWSYGIPFYGKVRRTVLTATFARTMSLLMSGGTAPATAFRMMAAVFPGKVFSGLMEQAAARAGDGEPVEKVLGDMAFFPAILNRLLGTAHATGHLDRMLDKAAREMDKQTDADLDRLVNVLEPSLILVLAIIVGLILLSVVLPVVRIMNAI
ncbi:type II secretion system F family protein [Anaerotalea alkaliphila]|uniref:Type II secretion system F family protein n=1 Tax=Anaerotalea alkaliphila TaxID=2662126 RepID=A0A7X5KKZ5_9FIRM|nr:type II secretion system F family protein [Anaerotalea alkaliphila]NDL66169.1 type II secretion system F family protein [Anaerotalea alkaliphila]